jgi:hypothetical protein
MQAPADAPDDPELLRGGRDYREVLAFVHDRLRPPLYLEVGVRLGNSLRLAKQRAIGIDPAPEVEGGLPPRFAVHAVASDDYFAASPPPGLDAPIDLAFIDGMHLFEFALRDFINIERHAAPWTLVLVDDILPAHPRQGARARSTRAWMGDVWRLAGCLRRHRPDLSLLALDTCPGGMLVVSGLDPDSRVLAERYDAIVADAMAQAEAPPPEAVLRRDGAVAASDAVLAPLCDRLRALRPGPA